METTSDNDQLNAGKGRGLRMAYALNNEQPVRCTIISDQPLFYMDFISDAEDDAFDMGGDDSFALPEEPVRTFAEDSGTARVMEAFLSDALYIGDARAAVDTARDDSFELALLVRTLERSRLAQGFIAVMNRHNGRFILNDQIESAFYDRKTGHIHINPNRARGETVLLAARELRRLWQHRAGTLIDPLSFHPDQAVLVNRAQSADLAACTVRIAWELQLSGEKDMWGRLEGSSMADLARAFAREAFMDFRTVNNGMANCAVFEAWFLSDRCRHEDRRLIQQMLAEYQGYVFEADQASVALAAQLIAALGGMPHGKNYLAPYVQTIVGDALFTEVRDRSNANFLWFIKFERSFRETERDLQSGPASGGDARSQKPHGTYTSRFGDHEKTADVIHLPQGGVDDETGRRQTADGKGVVAGSAAVIPFHGRLARRGRE